jgi:hypothetical protein
VDVLLEFDPKLIWVCGFDRVPGAAVFRLTQGSLTHTLTFGAVNDSTLTVTITVFFRDAAGTVLAARDSIVKIQKSPGLPEPFDSILKTTDWIHRRLNLATYLIFGGALVAVALWLYFNVQMMDQDKREALFIRTHLAPRRYTGSWSELFLIEPTSQSWLGRGDWSAAAQGWYVGHSPAAKRNPGKGLARIANAEWGMPQSYLFNDQQLYDYTVAIRCNLSAPSFNYSWVLRAQSGRPRGYVFTIRKFNQGIRVEGTVKWRFSSAPLIPVHGIDIIRQDCCRSGDYLIFKMQASNYDFKVTSFSLNNDDPNDDRDFVGTEIVDPAKSDAFRFRDGYGSYRYGTLALFAEDPKQGSEVEYVEVLEAK